MSTPTTDDPLDAVLADFWQRQVRGEAVTPQSLIETYPDLADSLREFFAAESFVARLAGPTLTEQTQQLSLHDTARNSLVGETIVSTGHTLNRCASEDEQADAPPLSQFGRYRVEKLLGRGAMGAVYLAHDPHLDRRVALKIPHFKPEEGTDMRERFYREAKAAATLRHANICPVYDVGRIEGVQYLTMAYIEGRTLAEELKGGRALETSEAVTIVRKLAQALHKAHSAGIVHRDLKPGNVMLDPDGEPVLMDFGLAYRAETDEIRLTRSGTIVGSPAYMSPEQIEGDPQRIGPASDIYSLGVVLYELLTGKLPFAGTMMSVIGQIQTQEPPLLGARRPELAGTPLEALCRRMMAKQPADRPASMQEVAAELSWIEESGDGSREPGDREQGRFGFQPPAKVVAEPVLPPQPAGRGGAGVAIGLLVLTVATMCVLPSLGIVAYIATDNGTLVIESDDPSVEITITQPQRDTDQTLEVRIVDRVTGSQVVRLASGHYRLMLGERGNEFTLSKDQFVLRRGEKVVARIVRRPSAAAAKGSATFTEVGRLVGHKDNIQALAYSRDGKYLFAGDGDRLLQQWDVQAGRIVRTIPVGDFPRGIAVHPDGRHVISSQYGGSITMWSLESGRAVRQFSGHTKAVQALAIAPDGKQLLSGGFDGLVRLWDIETGEPIRSFQENYCDAVALTSDGRLAVHGATGSGVRIWQTETGETLHEIGRAGAAVCAAAFSPDGTVLVTGDGYGLIQVWDAKTGKQIHRFDAHTSFVTSLAFLPGGRYFVSGSFDKTIRLFDLAQGLEIAHVQSATLCVSHLAIAPDGRTLASGGGKRLQKVDGQWQPVKDGDYDIRLWRLADVLKNSTPEPAQSDLRAITEILKIDGHTEHVSSLAVTRGGQTIVSASADGTVLARDLEPRRTRRAFSGHRRERQVAIDASSDGTLIVSGDFDGKLRLNRSGAGSVKEIDAHEGGVLMVRLSQDATKVLTTGCDNNAKLWNAESGELIQTFQGHTGWVPDGAFGEFDWQVATTSTDRTIRLWSAATGAEIAQLDTGGEIAVTLRVSPDLQTIAAGMRDGSVRLFGAKERNERRRLVGHTDRVRDEVFTPDSKHLISGSYDRTMRVWSVETGAEVARIEHARHIFNALAMSPDGRHVFSAGGIWKPDEEKNEWTPENDYAIRMWLLPAAVWPPGAESAGQEKGKD